MSKDKFSPIGKNADDDWVRPPGSKPPLSAPATMPKPATAEALLTIKVEYEPDEVSPEQLADILQTALVDRKMGRIAPVWGRIRITAISRDG